ncbi:MAG: hypothetical protein LUG18_06470 [Candidatus Azobacteroides sp.]|nr:hypothetical protein [Candidatus Azobacteroides sp.]
MSYKLITLLILISLNIPSAKSQVAEVFVPKNKTELPSKQQEKLADDLFEKDSDTKLSASGGGPGTDPGGLLDPDPIPVSIPTNAYFILTLATLYIVYVLLFRKKRKEVRGEKRKKLSESI